MERTGDQRLPGSSSGYDAAAAGWGAPAVHPVLAALGTVTDTYGKAVDASLWSLSRTELVDAVDLAVRAVNQAQGMLVRLIGEAEQQGIPSEHGAVDGIAWLHDRHRLGQAEATSYVQTSRRTRTDHPATGAALADGRLTLQQAAAIGRALTDLGPDVP
jgi:hypothetical protein